MGIENILYVKKNYIIATLFRTTLTDFAGKIQ